MIGVDQTPSAALLTFVPVTIHPAVPEAISAQLVIKVPVACRTLVLAETTQALVPHPTHATVVTPVAIVMDQILVTSEIRMTTPATYRIRVSAMAKRTIAGLISVKLARRLA
jgi:hypothetical protein